ncbi:SusC/RagA family TonB-linked outer membrane protein [Marinilabilia sp.]|uniref:SusC/RagA family TonB-linked outer membrane protein n=1 Tax=Marinilabilia sp. TaxID=2021252 RepID=UPI0025C0A86E|nr:SusC/RagA family TonB-linked outer membrane protein [Marinilabilia sp.]
MKKTNFFKQMLILLFLTFIVGEVAAQQITVQGTVAESSTGGEPIPGVSVVQKGTMNGTITDVDGNYQIMLPEDATLVFSFIGFKTTEVPVNGQENINVDLEPSVINVQEVVVTALGIEKRSKGLTYSTQSMSGDELTDAKDVNLVNSLTGKSAGVVITKSSSGLGGSSKMLIRGNRSAGGNNQPLYVIDGMPMLNSVSEQPSTSIGGTNDAGGRDSGDGISNLNPEDIKSINILKGASAAALYGTQAANGVIVITTKKGLAGRTTVNVSSNTTVESAVSLPEFQDKYGHSSGGFSWGDKINGSADYVDDFFKTGVTTINSMSLSSGSEKMQTYFSYANTSAKGIIDGNKLKKHNLNFRESGKFFNDKLSLDANVNLLNQSITNKPVAGGYYLNPLVGLYRFPRGMDMQPYKEDFEVYSIDRNLNVQNWHKELEAMEQNPYWINNRMPSKDRRNRVLSSLTARLDINSNLNVQLRGNVDYTNDRYNKRIYASTHTALAGSNGRYIVMNREEILNYGDFLLNYNNVFGDISLNASLGASVNDTKVRSERLDSRPNNLHLPNVFTVANMDIGYIEEMDLHRQMQSVFGTAQVGFKDLLFLDVTGRNDWSSALANTDSENSGFFYPSVGLTAVLSDMMNMPGFIDFGKVRGSWSSVGNDIPVYISNPTNSLAAGGNLIFNSEAPFDNLKPELSKSVELGTEWRMFANKLSLDLTYYKTNTENQLFTLPAPAGSGFSSYYVNAGNIQNEGFEAVVGITPLAENDLFWKSTINFATNKNTVKELHPDLKEFRFGDQTSNSYWMKLVEGGSFGDIYGVAFARNESGEIIYDENDLPTRQEEFIKIANASPDFSLGWNNSITVKNFNFQFLIDGRFGGDAISLTQADLDQFGVTQETAEARDRGYVELEGRKINNVREFYNRVGGRNGISEYYVYDATNVRLREVILGYSLGEEVFGTDSFVKNAKVSLIGRNLFFIYKDAPYDPEAQLSVGNNLQGVDVFGMPGTRSYGLNVKLTF